MSALSIAIPHRPDRVDRRRWVEASIAQLREEDASLPITVVEDTRCEGFWPTFRRALEAAGDVSHHLVLQDDLGLCKDFIGTVNVLTRMRPQDLIELYTGSKFVTTVRERGESWLEKSRVSGPAVIWPRHYIGEFLDWQSRHIRPSCPYEDVRVSIWLMKTSKRAYATVPSLVEHLGWNSSTHGLNAPTRVAAWFIGERRSGMSIDWSRGLDSPSRDPGDIRSEWWSYYRD